MNLELSPSIPGSSKLLDGWHILDCLWPEDAVSIDRRDGLKSLGCSVLTNDCFDLGNIRGSALQPTSSCVFVLSNLNWRGRQKRVAGKYGFNTFTLGWYNQILCRFLRGIAPTSHIIVLARRSDDVMATLLALGMPLFVQPLCASHDHRPMISTATDAADAPVRDIGPGQQTVGVLVAPACVLPFEFVDGAGFKLAEFLASWKGQVWFLGEGDARLASYCAQVKLVQPTDDQHTFDNAEEKSCKRKERRKNNNYEEIYKCVANSKKFDLTDTCDLTFAAALFSASVDLSSSAKCQNCDRYSSPEDVTYCCRTCSYGYSANGSVVGKRFRDDDTLHGQVCNVRHWLRATE